jgi:hypothetical protein
MVITLEDEVPLTWNRLYSGKHWSVRKAEADRVHELVGYAIDLGARPKYNEPVHITVTYYRSDGRTVKDPCNIPAKIYIDALVHAGILDDDTYEHVASVTTRIIPAENPKLTIQLQTL